MIFWYSGTGNSLYTARALAAQLGPSAGPLVSIADAMAGGLHRFEASPGEKIGFVFPVYFFGLPCMLSDFVSSLTLDCAGEEPFVYAVLTCGAGSGRSGLMFEKALRRCGLPLSALHSVVMIDNYVPMFQIGKEDDLRAALAKADESISVVAESLKAGKRGDFDRAKGTAAGLFTALGYPVYLHGRKTKRFTVSSACTACGLCAKVCPTGTIVMKDGKPFWQNPRCELCLACLHRCPVQAINWGKKTAAHGRYVHPAVF